MNNDRQSEGITWISTQSLIKLRLQANQLLLDSSKIHAKQGGAYLSSFKGRGMEFDESRIYQAGDDIRNMDWRVTARTGTAHTKVFREERERPVLLWLDLNESMMFATRKKFKAVIAAQIASLLAWSAAMNNDRVGGLIFAADEHIEIKPRRGKTAALDFIGRTSNHHAWSTAHHNNRRNMRAAISRLRKVAYPGSLIFMISDFRDMDEKAFSNIASIAKHNDIVMIKIHDPIEVALPDSGNYRLTDGVNELQIDTTNENNRKEYAQHYRSHQDSLERFCRRNRIHLIDVSTEDDPLQALKAGLGVHTGSARANRAAQYRSA